MNTKINDLTCDELLEVFNQAHTELKDIDIVLDKVREKGYDVGTLEGTPVRGLSIGITILLWFLLYGLTTATLIWFFNKGNTNESNNISNTIGFLPFFGMIISTILVVMIRKVSKSNKEFIYRDDLDTLTNQLNTLVQEADDFIEKRADKALIIPETYRYSLAVETMRCYIIDGLVDTWRECAMMYRDQLHKWTLEENSQEALELQKQIARTTESVKRSAQAAAIFSGISAVASIATLGKMTNVSSRLSNNGI